MPSARHPSSTRRRTTPSPLPKSTTSRSSKPYPLTPGLKLSDRLLSTHSSSPQAYVKEVLLFPTSLAILSSPWIHRFAINTTPQLGAPLPPHIESFLFQKYSTDIPLVSKRDDYRHERLPFLHIGSTAIALLQKNFYLILPNANLSPTLSPPLEDGTGHMSYGDIQRIYDDCIRPALNFAYPKVYDWRSWIQAKNESHERPLKLLKLGEMSGESQCQCRYQHEQQRGRACVRGRSSSSFLSPTCSSSSSSSSSYDKPLQERLHCEGLGALWDGICRGMKEIDLMQGAVLVAFAGSGKGGGGAEGSWKPSWEAFQRAWDEAVDVDWKGEGERVVVEMELRL